MAVDECRAEVGQFVCDRFISRVAHHAREVPMVLVVRLQQQLANLFAQLAAAPLEHAVKMRDLGMLQVLHPRFLRFAGENCRFPES